MEDGRATASPDEASGRRHRRAMRRAAHGMRCIAADLAHGRGPMPADEPPDQLADFVAELRILAGRIEGMSRDQGVADAKRMAIGDDGSQDAAHGPGRRRAGLAALTLLNHEASAERLDPYAGMKRKG